MTLGKYIEKLIELKEKKPELESAKIVAPICGEKHFTEISGEIMVGFHRGLYFLEEEFFKDFPKEEANEGEPNVNAIWIQ
jgi:hypothetical protein